MGKHVSVITGGGGGFGKAAAIELGKRGPVVLADFNQTALEYALDMLKKLNIEAYGRFVNIADEASCRELAEYAASLGDVKAVVNIAGVAPGLTYTNELDTDEEPKQFTSVKAMIDINAMGAINMFESFYPILAEGAAYINWASSVAYYVDLSEYFTGVFDTWQEPGFAERMYAMLNPDGAEESYSMSGKAYMFTKLFVTYHTYANIMRMAAKKCRIVSVSPGHYDTANMNIGEDKVAGIIEEHPLKALGRAVDMAAFIAFLCSDSARYINGRDYYLDGGVSNSKKIRQAQ